MRTYTVTCIEKNSSGNWRVRTEIGGPFVLIGQMGRWRTPVVIWMQDPRPGRTVQIKVPDWWAMRKRQLVGDDLYEANLKRKRDLRQRKRTGADPQLWDRRFKTARGERSTAELTLAKFRVTDGEKAAMTREAIEARGGRVVMSPVGVLVAFERGRLRGRVYDEAAVERPDDPVLSRAVASEAPYSGADGRKGAGEAPTTQPASGRPELTS